MDAVLANPSSVVVVLVPWIDLRDQKGKRTTYLP